MNLKDYATSNVATAPSPASSGTTLSVRTGEGVRFPTVPFYAVAYPDGNYPTLDNAELVLVTERVNDDLTIIRAQGSTTAKDITAGWRLSNPILTQHLAPVGTIHDYAGTTAPDGYLLCYGQALDADANPQYQALYDVIGNTFGGTNNTDFIVPDLRGRVVAGQDDMGGTSANRLTGVTDSVNGDTFGAAGGVEQHWHWQTVGADADDLYIRNAGAGASPTNTKVESANRVRIHKTDYLTSTNGRFDGTEYGSTVQPTIILNKIIKY